MISYITLFAEHTFEKITAADILSNIREGAWNMCDRHKWGQFHQILPSNCKDMISTSTTFNVQYPKEVEI